MTENFSHFDLLDPDDVIAAYKEYRIMEEQAEAANKRVFLGLLLSFLVDLAVVVAALDYFYLKPGDLEAFECFCFIVFVMILSNAVVIVFAILRHRAVSQKAKFRNYLEHLMEDQRMLDF
jgi:hypothetical protein